MFVAVHVESYHGLLHEGWKSVVFFFKALVALLLEIYTIQIKQKVWQA